MSTEKNLKRFYPELGTTLGDACLLPLRSTLRRPARRQRRRNFFIKGCSHITGGGFYENIPRMLPDGITARVRKDSYPVLPIFTLMQKKGELEEKMMYNTFNMGIGMVLALDSADAAAAVEALRAAGEEAYVIGETESGPQKGVELC